MKELDVTCHSPYEIFIFSFIVKIKTLTIHLRVYSSVLRWAEITFGPRPVRAQSIPTPPPMLGVPIRRALSSAAGSAAGGVSRSGLRNVVLVDGARLPFQPAMSAYNDLISYDLARLAMTGLITKTGVSPKEVDYVLMGTVLQEVKTSNLARDAALASGFPKSVPAHTISQACISANQAICTGMSFIQTGQADVVLAGGVETFSDVPIRFSRPLRKALLATTKIKGGPMKKLKAFKGLKLSDLAPDQPAVANFITGEVMGHSSDRLAEKFGVTRKEQDEFALR